MTLKEASLPGVKSVKNRASDSRIAAGPQRCMSRTVAARFGRFVRVQIARGTRRSGLCGEALLAVRLRATRKFPGRGGH